jgi:MFS superfamily sulfate permease-like transporter
VIIFLNFATKIMKFIPSAALSSIIIVSVIKMFNYKIVYKMWKVSPLDIIPWAVSFFLCTFKGIEYGVGIGIGVNVLILLYKSARPQHATLIKDDKTLMYRPKTEHDDLSSRVYESDDQLEVPIMRVGASLYFSAGSHWKDEVSALLLESGTPPAIVIDYSAVATIDFSGIQAVLECTDDCAKRGVRLYSAGMNQEVKSMLGRAGYWNNSEKTNVEYWQLLPVAVQKAQAYMESELMAQAEDLNEGDASTPLLNSVRSRRNQPKRKFSGMLGAKMSGVGGRAGPGVVQPINTIN